MFSSSSTNPRVGLRIARGAAATLGVLLAMLVVAVQAHAAFGIAAFDGEVNDAAGQPYTQAGGHPFEASTEIQFASHADADHFGAQMPDESTKTIRVDLPVGFVGNPSATPRCSSDDLFTTGFTPPTCPASSQVGIVRIDYGFFGPAVQHNSVPVYNIAPANPADPAEFGFKVLTTVVKARAEVRSDDHGLTVEIPNVPEGLAMVGSRLTFWGVPGDPRHDAQRGSCLNPDGTSNGICKAGIAPVPFLTLPTACTAPGVGLETRLTVDSWEHPGTFRHGSFFSHLPPAYPAPGAPGPQQGTTGCDTVPFHPSAAVQAQSRTAGSPSGLVVDLSFPQDGMQSASGIATAHLKRATVTLPAGMTLSPAAADGLVGCSDAQIGIGSDRPAACPAASRIGAVVAQTPVLDADLTGGIYLGTQRSGDPMSGQMFRIFLTLKGPGVLIKLRGQVRANPGTGRLVTTFDDNPQLPVSDIRLAFKSGPRAPLVTPLACGRYATRVALAPWSGAPAAVIDVPMAIDRGCGQEARFEPSFEAGVTNPVAGASSPFVMRFGRPDGEQELGSINGSLPPGLLGALKAVPLCPAAQGAAGTCPAASRVGKVQVAAGAGSHPLWLPVAGRPEDAVYLTEPYRKGDVAGMSIVVPAVAGPFDLGTVVTKVYLRLRPADQGIDLQSDRLPRVVGGVPVRIREVVVTIDRAGFMVNPTSCAAMATYANVFSQSWAKAPVTSRFQVGGCASLPLSPIIRVAGGGKGDTKRYEHPALEVSIRQSSAQAHLSKANVVLPKAFNVDLKAPALKAACPREVYAEDECSPVATVGTVTAITPLLREPLTGPAFLLQKKGALPDIVMRLRNDRMSLDLIGVLDFLRDGRLITRVKGIPDAALSSFVLSIKGGKDGSLLNRGDLCAHRRLTRATFKGQNGKLSRKSPVTRISGCAKARSRVKASARSASARAARVASARASAARGVHADPGDERAVGGRS